MTIAPAATPAAPSQLLDTVLRAAAGVTGMQLVYVASIGSPQEQPADESPGEPTVQTCTWQQLLGKFDGITSGFSVPLSDTFDGRLLTGAPSSTSDAAFDPHYADVPMRQEFGIASFVGVPLRRADGLVTGILGGIDGAATPITPADVRVLTALGRLITADAELEAGDPQIRLHRTAGGWEVEQGVVVLAGGPDGLGAGEPAEDLTVAMSLADLLAADAGNPVPMQRPLRSTEELTEGEQLRLQITQLEHALSARVVIEQAIGVLAERFSVTPREAFDRMRKSARSRGQRVHELSLTIMRSARDDTVVLPQDLSS